MVVATTSDGYTLTYTDAFGDPLPFSCTLSGNDYTCSGAIVMLESSSPDGDATASFAVTISGAWLSDTTFTGDITGALDCTGSDMAACNEAATGWGLTFPCTMGYPLDAALGG